MRHSPLPTVLGLVLAGCTAASSGTPTVDAPADSDTIDGLPMPLVDALIGGGRPVALVQLADPDAQHELAAEPHQRLWQDRADGFLRDLPGGVHAERVYDNFPVVAVTLDDFDAAWAVVDADGVVGITPDVPHEATLTQSLDLINQPEAEAAGFTGAGTAVAVLDTGADWTHADLGSCTAVGTPSSTCRVAYAADFATSDGSRDDNGHGTNVSSIVAAVAPGTDILALDVFRSDGYAYTSDILTAIDWVIANQATYNIASINMSLGSGGYTATCADAFSTGVTAAHDAGVAVAVASGNNAYTNKISSPACSADAFSVGAVYDSNMGGVGWSVCSDASTAADKVTCFSNTASFLDILAPGTLITAGGYSMGGTSQATPHVAGALAVLRAADSAATADALEAKLVETGTSVTDSRTGLSFPRLDLEAAVADCVSSVSATSISPAAAGASGSVDVTTTSGCTWTVSSDASWLTLDKAGDTDSGSFTWTAAANTGSARTATLTLSGRSIAASQAADSPPTGTVSIAAGATGTKTAAVTLTLAASDSTGGVSTMCVSNTSTCTSWQAYATSLAWSLSAGTGTKTVYVWFRDSYGNTSSVASDTIVVDTTAPKNGTVTATGADASVALSWTGYSDTGAGISSYKIVQSATSAPASCTAGTTVYTGSATSTTLTGLTNGSTYGWRVCAVDGAGNTSTGSTATATIAPEYTAPTGTIVVNSGATWTNSRTATATLSATDDTSVSSMCVSTATSCSTYVTYATSASVALASKAGSQTVYAWFKDPYGNVSSATSDTISYDGTAPTNGTLTATAGSGQVALAWTGFSDAGSGLASYTVVYAAGTAPSSCSAGTVAYSGTGTSSTLTGLTTGTAYGFRVCATDTAGNKSTGATKTATAL